MGTSNSRTDLLRTVLRSLNGTIKTITQLDRDPPIVKIANIQMQNGFKVEGFVDLEKELFILLNRVNKYRSKYWKIQGSITQSFLRLLKEKKYLPSYSLEVESLKNALPESIIKGDERIWVYSFDHYIKIISEKVGRDKKEAPSGDLVYTTISKKINREILELERTANDLLPDLHMLKGKVHSLLKDPGKTWGSINMKKPRVELVKRPIRKAIVVKRPLPIPKKGKMPRKKVLKKLDVQVIGPEDNK
jgi:hypothetical protein